MNVLIVEDELIAASYLEQILIDANYTIIDICDNGKKAIEIARVKKPDLILMDIMLKGSMSGVDAAVAIRRNSADVMIVFLTAYSEESMIETAIEASPQGYFLKPYNKEEILVNLKILIAKKNAPITEKIKDTILLTENYNYNTKYKQLYHYETEVYLSKLELKLVHYLCKNTHTVLDFDKIIKALWNVSKPQQNLRSLIHRIREKTSVNLIKNVNKLGYKIALKE